MIFNDCCKTYINFKGRHKDQSYIINTLFSVLHTWYFAIWKQNDHREYKKITSKYRKSVKVETDVHTEHNVLHAVLYCLFLLELAQLPFLDRKIFHDFFYFVHFSSSSVIHLVHKMQSSMHYESFVWTVIKMSQRSLQMNELQKYIWKKKQKKRRESNVLIVCCQLPPWINVNWRMCCFFIRNREIHLHLHLLIIPFELANNFSPKIKEVEMVDEDEYEDVMSIVNTIFIQINSKKKKKKKKRKRRI